MPWIWGGEGEFNKIWKIYVPIMRGLVNKWRVDPSANYDELLEYIITTYSDTHVRNIICK